MSIEVFERILCKCEVCGDERRTYVFKAELAELVKAARALVEAIDKLPADLTEHVVGVRAALKPFGSP